MENGISLGALETWPCSPEIPLWTDTQEKWKYLSVKKKKKKPEIFLEEFIHSGQKVRATQMSTLRCTDKQKVQALGSSAIGNKKGATCWEMDEPREPHTWKKLKIALGDSIYTKSPNRQSYWDRLAMPEAWKTMGSDNYQVCGLLFRWRTCSKIDLGWERERSGCRGHGEES